MNTFLKAAAALAIASTVAFFAGQSHAAAFATWEIHNLPFGDTLHPQISLQHLAEAGSLS